MFSATVRRLAQSAKESGSRKVPPIAASNFQKTKKVWPPNFKELSHQEQLRFEKKYKRRIMMASRSPRWEKGIKYAQLLTIAGKIACGASVPEIWLTFALAALVWLLFYSEFEWWGQQYKPSEEVCKTLLIYFCQHVLTCSRFAAARHKYLASLTRTSATSGAKTWWNQAQQAKTQNPSLINELYDIGRRYILYHYQCIYPAAHQAAKCQRHHLMIYALAS